MAGSDQTTNAEAWTTDVTVVMLATRLMETFAAPNATEEILAAVRDALGGNAAALYLVTATDGAPRLVHALCSPSSTDDFSDTQIAAATIRADAPLILPDETPPLVSLPVMIGGTRYGVVQITGIANPYHDPDARPFLTEIGTLLGATFERARQRRELETLRATMLQLSTSLDLTRTLEAILDGVISLVPCTIATIYLDEIAPDALVRVAQRTLAGTDLAAATQPRPLDRSITGWVYRNRQSLLVPDLSADPRVLTGPEAPPKGLASIVVPLLAGDRAVGTFIASRYGPNAFTERDLTLAESFAPLAAQAVVNARLYAERIHYQAQAEVLLEDLGDATVRADASGVTMGWNKRAEQLYGYTAEETIGHRMLVVPPEEREATMAMVRRAMQGETIFNVETERMHKDGHRINVLTTVSPWREQGKIVGVLAIVKDISDRKALERELTEQVRAGRRRERDTTYVAAVAQACNSAADGLAILQALVNLTAEWADDARVITVEGERVALAAYASRTPEDDTAVHASLHYTYGAGSTTIGTVEVVRNIRAPVVEDMHHPTITITPAPFLARGYHTKAYIPIRAAGDVVGILIAGARGETPPFDAQAVATLELVAEQAGLAITKTRLLRQVEAHVAQLEDANQHKDDFLASLSHELRTPLNAILGFGELIEDGAIEDPEELRDVAHDIVVSGRLLLDQVNGLLDMARVSSGQMEMARELVDVPALVTKCERILAPLIATKQQHLRVSLVPDLPPVAADGARLQQVLLNLLTNAYKFTPEGGTITVEGTVAECQVTIAVRDTGIGIAPEYVATIFEPFRRVETGYARSQSGTGLGLALSRRLIELMGGTLTLDSTPGSGSLFTVTLPM